METKIMFERGNLFTGYPYGVEAELAFDCSELHGPFSSENQANTYMHKLVEGEATRYVSVKVVRIETPQAGRHIVRVDGVYVYAGE